MGTTGRPRRWKLPFHRTPSRPSSPSSSSPSSPAPSVPSSPAVVLKEEADLPAEFLCPISNALMADPVILPSGQTYERACVEACAEMSFSPPGLALELEPPPLLIPNAALKAAIGSWCAHSGRPLPSPPSAAAARHAVVRLMPSGMDVGPATPPAAAASVRTRRPPARATCSNSSASSASSYSSAASTSSYTSSSEITAAEEEAAPKKAAKVTKESEPADALEEEVLAKVMDSDEPGELEAAMAALRQATRESAARRRALCTPRLLAALRPMLLLSRHAAVQTNAAAALVNLSVEPANKVPIVRAGAVPPLVEVLRVGAPEAREHSAGALFGLALDEDNRAAIGVLGAVPPLVQLLASTSHTQRARRDAGMALYHLSLAAVNQSKLARAAGAAKALLSVASNTTELAAIRRVALMVVCNMAACLEGRAALMDADAVATVSAMLANDARKAELEEWCVAAMYGMSKGSLRFRGLARAAGVDKVLKNVAEEGSGGGMRPEMARKTLRAMRGDYDNDLTGTGAEYGDGDDGGSIVSEGLMSFRRRHRELGTASCSNTTEF